MYNSKPCRSTARNKVRVNFNKTSHPHHCYFNRIVRLWNALPPLDLSLSFSTLKLHLKQLFWKHFIVHFSPSNLCTFHVVCPCPHCVNCNHSVSLKWSFAAAPVFGDCLSALHLLLSSILSSHACHVMILH